MPKLNVALQTWSIDILCISWSKFQPTYLVFNLSILKGNSLWIIFWSTTQHISKTICKNQHKPCSRNYKTGLTLFEWLKPEEMPWTLNYFLRKSPEPFSHVILGAHHFIHIPLTAQWQWRRLCNPSMTASTTSHYFHTNHPTRHGMSNVYM